jgi:hypothetical protein
LKFLTEFSVFFAIPGSQESRLNTEAIREGYDTLSWYPHVPTNVAEPESDSRYHVRVVNGQYHNDHNLTGRMLERKIFVGVVISYVTPNLNGTLYGTSPSTKNSVASLASGKRIKSGIHMLNPKGKCMMLADCATGSVLVVCLMLTGRNSLFASCGNSAFANEVTMGDVIGVYEPSISTRSLGSIPIFDEWTKLVLFRRNLSLPERPILMSSTANLQVHFYRSGVSVQFFKSVLLVAGAVTCVSVTCDRQNSTCQGCHGIADSKRNFVLQTIVEVLDQPQYDAKTSMACFVFRSFHLTKLLIDIVPFSGMDYQEMTHHTSIMRGAIAEFADYVNQHGGWTVIGWHRRGVISGNEDGTTQLNEYTAGHLVRLEPTNMDHDFLQDLRGRRYMPAPPQPAPPAVNVPPVAAEEE